ncbi:response regulator transcription factor [Rhodobacter sp. SGA-6-6]|uniref:response regulator transcription factor n=1 Tax=Rhodobacter sp. SGA-6-6 TaxID=2710882 RepID=UPI0013E9CBD7|nr:response regulator [Rhodobacter sp. SGA-6-6]NGM47183.1 response regulator transcription factor [Rhodobacter sp. SGA-6-6]
MTQNQLTVFLVDDDEAIRLSLSRALAKRGYRVEAHASAASFLAAWSEERRGCLVLDYGMPGMNGLELQARLNAMGATLPVIFITGHGGVPESVQAIKGGALDFLEKPFRQAALIQRIEAALDLARGQETARQDGQRRRALFDRLTAREMEIVERIVERPAETSSKEIALYLGISPRTVDHHRARILEKLGLKSIVELIAVAKG